MQGTTWWGSRRAVALAGLLVVAGVVAACTPPPPGLSAPPTTLQPLPAPPAQFTTLAYNVAGLPQEISRGNPRQHIPLISPLLNEYDVVLTQEDFDWWSPLAGMLDFRNYHARLRADATHPYRTDVHPGPTAVGISPRARPLLVGDGIGMLSRFPFTGERHHAWSKCNGDAFFGAADCLAMKGFRIVTMTLGDGRLVDVYSLHAEAGSGARDQQLQELNYREMADVILARDRDRAIIVGGDTNLHIVDGRNEPNTGEVDRVIWQRFLDETGLTDVCVEVSCAEPENIDKFAYRSSSTVELTPLEMTFPRDRFSTPAGRELSDHAPVVVRWSWDVPAG